MIKRYLTNKIYILYWNDWSLRGSFSQSWVLGQRPPDLSRAVLASVLPESLFMGHTPTHKTSFLLFPFGPYHFSKPSQEIVLVWYKLVFTDRMAILVSFLSPFLWFKSWSSLSVKIMILKELQFKVIIFKANLTGMWCIVLYYGGADLLSSVSNTNSWPSSKRASCLIAVILSTDEISYRDKAYLVPYMFSELNLKQFNYKQSSSIEIYLIDSLQMLRGLRT